MDGGRLQTVCAGISQHDQASSYCGANSVGCTLLPYPCKKCNPVKIKILSLEELLTKNAI